MCGRARRNPASTRGLKNMTRTISPDRSISYYNKGQILGVMLDLADSRCDRQSQIARRCSSPMNDEYARSRANSTTKAAAFAPRSRKSRERASRISSAAMFPAWTRSPTTIFWESPACSSRQITGMPFPKSLTRPIGSVVSAKASSMARPTEMATANPARGFPLEHISVKVLRGSELQLRYQNIPEKGALAPEDTPRNLSDYL